MKKFQCLIMILLLLNGVVAAQKKTITGKVTGANDTEALQGVNILANNQKNGTTTDKEGNYSIQVAANTTTLIFSYVGYSAKTVEIGTNKTINVSLSPATVTGDEVVVIGYGLSLIHI